MTSDREKAKAHFGHFRASILLCLCISCYISNFYQAVGYYQKNSGLGASGPIWKLCANAVFTLTD